MERAGFSASARSVAATLLALMAISVSVAQAEDLEVQLAPNETIRELSEKYLGDPDLWPEILKASHLASVAQLSPGLSLRVPQDLVAAVDRALARGADQIRHANLAGAQLFAPDEIGRAIAFYDEALGRRVERSWSQAKDLALKSYSEATEALTISEDRRDEAAEALLSDRNGWVEAQKPKDLAWNDVKLRAVLVEEEKVRTLSDSTAQLTFRDASRLRLNANSNAVIQEMRYDPLTKHDEAKVSLIEGDFYALLASESERTSFAVDIPEAQAHIESGDFWVKSDDDGAKFTNYDDRPVAVATSTEKIVLGRNEGVVLSTDGEATEKRDVLAAPQLSSPADDGTVYNASIDLAWTAPSGAAGFWLELASDQSFDTMVLSEFGISEPAFRVEKLPPGEYYWRVAALDAFGLPGQRSAPSRFTLALDSVPPFLRIDTPIEGTIERENTIEVRGETEPGAAVTVNGSPVETTARGQFVGAMTAGEGENRVEIVAVDPAGNTTRQVRGFSYMPDRAEAVTLDATIPRDAAGGILTGGRVVSLTGRTKPDCRIDVLGADGSSRGSTASDAAGRFALNADLSGDRESLSIVVTAPSGFQSPQTVDIIVDRTRPTIALAEEFPRLTASGTLFVKGNVAKPGANLLINGREATLSDGGFDEIINLSVGENPIELVATDKVGNVDVVRFSVTLDSEPPQLVGAKLTAAGSSAGSLIAIEVTASDASGLAATALSTVGYGTEVVDGVLKFNRATRTYQGSIPVPHDALRSAKIRTVELTDAAGNRRSYRVN